MGGGVVTPITPLNPPPHVLCHLLPHIPSTLNDRTDDLIIHEDEVFRLINVDVMWFV